MLCHQGYNEYALWPEYQRGNGEVFVEQILQSVVTQRGPGYRGEDGIGWSALQLGKPRSENGDSVPPKRSVAEFSTLS